MAKNIVKEIIIVLLLILAIILILGIILYEYVPNNKIIPEKVSYTTPEDVKQELQTDNNVDNTEIVLTHQIDATDLTNYKRIQEYVPGKKNPFGSVNEIETNTTATGGSSSTTTSGQNGTSTTTSTSSSTSTTTSTNTSTSSSSNSVWYLPDKGTK